jgi:hypothetical protein
MNTNANCPKHKTGGGPCYCGRTPSKVTADDSPELAKNPILNWTWDKPTEPGLYLVCRGDIEVQENIEPLRLVDEKFGPHLQLNGWNCYTAGELSQWNQSFKFARLCFGKEAQS